MYNSTEGIIFKESFLDFLGAKIEKWFCHFCRKKVLPFLFKKVDNSSRNFEVNQLKHKVARETDMPKRNEREILYSTKFFLG